MRCSLITPQQITHDRNDTEPGTPIIILLRAGVLVPEAAAKLGTYHEVFSQFLQDGLNYQQHTKHLASAATTTSKQERIQLISYNVMQNTPESSHPDQLVEYPSHDILTQSIALIISGSASNAYEDIPWINQLVSFSTELVHSYLHLKLLGICFGHQIFARALGAQVIRNPLGWEFGIYEVQLSLLGQTLFQDADSPAPNLLKLHQVHRDIVVDLPASIHSIGSTPNCTTHGFLLLDPPPEPDRLARPDEALSASELTRRIRLLTLQGHPEFTTTILRDALNARTRNGTDWSIVDKDSYQTALDSIHKFPHQSDHHGSFVSHKFLQILNIIT
ncbi:hypothetical protein PCASD_08435 [Puccinia coronata f. sp. avenae]|uniref:Glutamine amidotransferase domain-containing protein n=1 Tax=Puccinia coronata f. sp. avenae TaxID=200324 RepID=A0A2N5UML7_9BASI|nr:hypothetical protein PCASD_08435 [Puccinia coronata f. sp. avenae]